MKRVLDAVRWAWVLTVWMALVLMLLATLGIFVGWYWPCQWDWQSVEVFTRCGWD
jgi:predicted membrane channel-forming protein YqfA (hemolysin III family)